MPLYVRHGPEKDSPGCPILPNDKAVYSDDFYEDTESYTHRPISRQTQPTLEIDFYLHRLWPGLSRRGSGVGHFASTNHCFHRHPCMANGGCGSSRIGLSGDHDGGAGTAQFGQIAICGHADLESWAVAPNDRTITIRL